MPLPNLESVSLTREKNNSSRVETFSTHKQNKNSFVQIEHTRPVVNLTTYRGMSLLDMAIKFENNDYKYNIM